MHKPESVFKCIREQGIRFSTGVPDSLLKGFCAYLTENSGNRDHVIAANEGNAIALAVGHYLSTGKPALVYMQNSGIGNAINPLLSLADPEVYSVPMLLLIGWRGEPGIKDEPQHMKQGRVMTELIDAMEIPWFELSSDTDSPGKLIDKACRIMRKKSMPVALLARKGAFERYSSEDDMPPNFSMNREGAIKCVIDLLAKHDVVVSTTGKASREVYEHRADRGDGHANDFLTVGGMGHTASIAMGVALGQPGRQVICLDGDGSVFMHMGALAIIGQSPIPNFIHVVINNGAHDSVGGQPTVGFDVSLPKVAEACGYRQAVSVSSLEEIRAEMTRLREVEGPVMLEILTNKGARDDLGRPKTTPLANRDAFMARLGVES
ncbi:MAG: phosphonopyruvate decarboxylase [Planctomycetota bacterium]|nr:MAG: phosphonopyruvate decarboxylase [Planctomycetota bacterium]